MNSRSLSNLYRGAQQFYVVGSCSEPSERIDLKGTIEVPCWNFKTMWGCSLVLFAVAECSRGSFFWLVKTWIHSKALEMILCFSSPEFSTLHQTSGHVLSFMHNMRIKSYLIPRSEHKVDNRKDFRGQPTCAKLQSLPCYWEEVSVTSKSPVA